MVTDFFDDFIPDDGAENSDGIIPGDVPVEYFPESGDGWDYDPSPYDPSPFNDIFPEETMPQLGEISLEDSGDVWADFHPTFGTTRK